MVENSSIKEDLTELTALYDIRADMHDFCQDEDNEFARIGVLSAYDCLLVDDDLRDKINSGIEEYMLKRLSVGNFDYEQVKTSDAENRKRKQSAERSKTQNTDVNKIKKQLKDEIAYQASQGKKEFQGLKNTEILSVSVDDKYFNVKISGRKEALKLSHWTAKGKHFSSCGMIKSRDKNFPYSGLNNSSYELIAAKGEEGFILEEMEAPKDLGRQYTPADYRKLLGLVRTAKLSDWQEKERAFLNKLSINEQKTFIIELNKYLVRKKKFKEVIDFVTGTENKLSLLTEPERLRGMLRDIQVNDDFISSMQKQFVHHIQNNKGIWDNFSKKNEENQQRFSRYEILQDNVIARNNNLFAELYKTEGNMKQKLKNSFTQIHHSGERALPDGLCSEIMALGIFKEGMKEPINAQKLERMNQLLNEFGLNIAFKSLPVVKAPAAEITNAKAQNKIDRENFEEFKLTEDYIDEEKRFYAARKLCGAEKVDDVSTHHYIALRYNGFVEAELNDNANLVKTARKNAWNYDGHDTVHLFDTAGEFLIKSDKGYSLANFNHLRNRFSAGESLEIQAPVLQVADENGNFSDLLALGKNGKSGHYISDDKTTQAMKIPDYCRTGIYPNLTHAAKLKLAKKAKA